MTNEDLMALFPYLGKEVGRGVNATCATDTLLTSGIWADFNKAQSNQFFYTVEKQCTPCCDTLVFSNGGDQTGFSREKVFLSGRCSPRRIYDISIL